MCHIVPTEFANRKLPSRLLSIHLTVIFWVPTPPQSSYHQDKELGRCSVCPRLARSLPAWRPRKLSVTLQPKRKCRETSKPGCSEQTGDATQLQVQRVPRTAEARTVS